MGSGQLTLSRYAVCVCSVKGRQQTPLLNGAGRFN